jgi:predicted metal-dependent phosphotriesterase family hydrolase
VGQIVEDMHARGFTDRELDVMFKENPAKLLGLASP